jgi:hypothetical protein
MRRLLITSATAVAVGALMGVLVRVSGLEWGGPLGPVVILAGGLIVLVVAERDVLLGDGGPR